MSFDSFQQKQTVVLAAEKIKLLRHQDKGGGGKERRLICNEGGGGTVRDFIARNDPMHYDYLQLPAAMRCRIPKIGLSLLNSSRDGNVNMKQIGHSIC